MKRLLAVGVVAPLLTMVAATAAALSTAFPDAHGTGTIVVERFAVDGTAATESVTVSAFRLEEPVGAPIDLTSQAGWNRAADLTIEEALSLPRDLQAVGPTVGGVATLDGLPIGLYLVTMVDAAGADASEPFVVALPQTNGSGTGWNWEVTARPKSAPATWAALEGLVWYDSNGNGLIDAAEPLVPGVTVHLFGEAPSIVGLRSFAASAEPCAAPAGMVETYRRTTGADGSWQVPYLPVAIKQVCFDVTGLDGPTGPLQFTEPGLDSAPNPATGFTEPRLLRDQEVATLHAGVVSAPSEVAQPTPTPDGESETTQDRPAITAPGGLPVTGATIAGAAVAGLAVLGGLGLRVFAGRRRPRIENSEGRAN